MDNRPADSNVLHGYLEFEEKENSNLFLLKYVCLDMTSCKMDYFTCKGFQIDEPKSSVVPEGTFNVHFMSMAADAASARPKIPNCFYIVVSGKKYYFKAPSETEKVEWIKKLQDASRITVPQRNSLMDTSQESGCKVEVVGGVILKTPLEDAGDDVNSDESQQQSPSSIQHIEEESIKSGYCTKQGVFRKSWKRRYFILSSSGLRYCQSVEDKTPIKILKVQDILEARPSIGIHLNRDHLFEVVTANRVFYIQATNYVDSLGTTSTSTEALDKGTQYLQTSSLLSWKERWTKSGPMRRADSKEERDSWIQAVNRCLQSVHGPKVLVTSI